MDAGVMFKETATGTIWNLRFALSVEELKDLQGVECLRVKMLDGTTFTVEHERIDGFWVLMGPCN
jgi:hypothetical protein